MDGCTHTAEYLPVATPGQSVRLSLGLVRSTGCPEVRQSPVDRLGSIGGRGPRYAGDNAFATTRPSPPQHGSSAIRNGSRRCRGERFVVARWQHGQALQHLISVGARLQLEGQPLGRILLVAHLHLILCVLHLNFLHALYLLIEAPNLALVLGDNLGSVSRARSLASLRSRLMRASSSFT